MYYAINVGFINSFRSNNNLNYINIRKELYLFTRSVGK